MEQVVPSKDLVRLLARFCSSSYPLQTMLRVHLIQYWFGLGDPAAEEALYEIGSTHRGLGERTGTMTSV